VATPFPAPSTQVAFLTLAELVHCLPCLLPYLSYFPPLSRLRARPTITTLCACSFKSVGPAGFWWPFIPPPPFDQLYVPSSFFRLTTILGAVIGFPLSLIDPLRTLPHLSSYVFHAPTFYHLRSIVHLRVVSTPSHFDVLFGLRTSYS